MICQLGWLMKRKGPIRTEPYRVIFSVRDINSIIAPWLGMSMPSY